ncbi:hypothetical protein J2X68_005231 [Streptomyces sp. 3330]|nr:hypothetical protein [Streptomyces sp. 3330]
MGAVGAVGATAQRIAWPDMCQGVLGVPEIAARLPRFAR